MQHDVLRSTPTPKLAPHPRRPVSRAARPSMAHSVAADDAPATLHPLALLLAGQVRTLQEERMRAELLSAVVQPSNAAVFAHLSPEESPAAWHFGPVGGRSDPSQVAPAATAALSAGFAAAFRREFRPVFFELVADAELQGHPRWAGELLGSVRTQSALYFRWLLLHDAVERREAAAHPARVWVLLAGLVQGLYASGGPLLVHALSRVQISRSRFRATLMTIWFTLNSGLSVAYLVGGLWTTDMAVRAAWLLPLVPIGLWAGDWLHHHASERGFAVAVQTVLLVAGLGLVFG